MQSDFHFCVVNSYRDSIVTVAIQPTKSYYQISFGIDTLKTARK